MKLIIKRSLYFVAFLLVMPMSLVSQEKQTKEMRWGAQYDFMAPRIGQWYSFNINGWVASVE
jgi:hypothetical protein